jgi:hypothetical protein
VSASPASLRSLREGSSQSTRHSEASLRAEESLLVGEILRCALNDAIVRFFAAPPTDVASVDRMRGRRPTTYGSENYFLTENHFLTENYFLREIDTVVACFSN